MQHLSGLDTLFLSLEIGHGSIHIGTVTLLDTSTSGDGFSFDRFRDLLASRLHLARTFRQRLVHVPLDLGHPYWIEDPDFDLSNHMMHLALPAPGGEAELMDLAGDFFAEPLDHDRPLWKFAVVDGVDSLPDLPSGSAALLGKVHHAAIDGLSGIEFQSAFFDMAPRPRKVRSKVDWHPDPVPGSADLLTRAYLDALSAPLKFTGMLTNAAQQLAHRAGLMFGLGAPAEKTETKPPALFQAPAVPFNDPLTARRAIHGTSFGLDRVKAIRSLVPGATVNDVLLAVCASALRGYLETQDALPDRSLVALAPISIRETEDSGKMGNRISAMLVRLATEVDDPLERLRLIHAGTAASKRNQSDDAARNLLTDLSETMPFNVTSFAGQMYLMAHVARHGQPPFNLIITNVPGPPFPLYCAGAKVVTQYGVGPMFDSLGMILVLLSYNGTVNITATVCPDLVPDAGGLPDLLQAGLAELEASAMPSADGKDPEANAEAV